jgi:hypothetical protein
MKKTQIISIFHQTANLEVNVNYYLQINIKILRVLFWITT